MARALSEVVVQARLPEGRLARLLAGSPDGRIVLTPMTPQGGPYPERFLVTATRLDARRHVLLEALSDLLDAPRVAHEGDGVVHLVGDLHADARRVFDGLLGESLTPFGRDVLHRPALLKGEWAFLSFITAREGPVEEAVQRVALALKPRGLAVRLVRLAPYHPEHQSLGAYEDELTPKQAEILRVALALGLYDSPRRCNLDDLAELFGISKAAAHNRMKGAERKILMRYFD